MILNASPVHHSNARTADYTERRGSFGPDAETALYPALNWLRHATLAQTTRNEVGPWRSIEQQGAASRSLDPAFPPQLALGLILLAVAWPLAWFGPAPFSEHTFFPLWFGYILVVDGLVQRRTGTSILTRGPARFALLFTFSLPLWWLFEGVNRFVGNWHYAIPFNHGPVVYALLASLSFSTVMPAIFETAELYRSFTFFQHPRRWVQVDPGRKGLIAIAICGVAMSAFAMLAPRIGFPFVWLGVYFFLDPLLALAGRPSIVGQIGRGRWDTVLVLFAAGLTCGLFWEMWNFWSLPKWTYDVPIVGRPKLFEMPVLGYGGYFPFALEVYVVYQFLRWRLGVTGDTIRFDGATAPQSVET